MGMLSKSKLDRKFSIYVFPFYNYITPLNCCYCFHHYCLYLLPLPPLLSLVSPRQGESVWFAVSNLLQMIFLIVFELHFSLFQKHQLFFYWLLFFRISFWNFGFQINLKISSVILNVFCNRNTSFIIIYGARINLTGKSWGLIMRGSANSCAESS